MKPRGQSTERQKQLKEYLANVRERHPEIKPRAEDDWGWWDEAFDFLDDGQIGMATTLFEELLLAEPHLHDGYEGLALVHERLGEKDQALMLIEEAIRIARGLLEKQDLDQELMDELLAERERMLELPEADGGER